tara:strand:+ start:20380 stop:20991 length:612 start_codon:yes stop_codon:yes gene_type:complete
LRIGVLGGTFDPVHNGHIGLADHIYELLDLDVVVFVPAKSPRLREEKYPQVEAQSRFEMVALAISDDIRFQVSDMELLRPGPSYTVHTVEQMSCDYKEQADIYLIVGSDVISRFNEWYKYETILEKCELVVYSRPGYCINQQVEEGWLKKYRSKIHLVDGPAYRESATEIRKQLQEGKINIDGLSPLVEKYIKREKLYIEGGA